MIPGGRNFKEIERKKIGSKSEQKQSKNRGKRALRISQLKKLLRNEHFVAKPFRNTLKSLREFSQLRRRVWHTSATSQHRSIHLQLRNALRSGKPDFAPKVPFRRSAPFSQLFIFFLSLTAKPPVIFSDHQLRPNFGNPKWREPEGLSLLSFKPQEEPAKGASSGSRS
ncbi:hypothetical protein CK203_031211 [Vitis vinifera]|uniref:Uncharacterized protein n=1 Tax=Vitis vinifera TaxID=29760 RepID=A0A438J0J1_VITVI|nr:hypothetical protein CK203_031211 [Vitis vinifera]